MHYLANKQLTFSSVYHSEGFGRMLCITVKNLVLNLRLTLLTGIILISLIIIG